MAGVEAAVMHPSYARRSGAVAFVMTSAVFVALSIAVFVLTRPGPAASPDHARLRDAYGAPNEVIGSPDSPVVDQDGILFDERWVWRAGEFETAPRLVAFLLDGVCVAIRRYYQEGIWSEEPLPWLER